MSTLGQKPATQHVSTEKQTITGNGGTSYTLQQSVSQAADIEVFVNNTRQEPTAAYTANNTTLTMTGAVNSSDSFYVIFQGKAIQTAGLPVDAAITASAITASQTITSTGNITTSGTLNTPSINGGQIGGRRNMIINGAMQVAQRGTSASGSQGYPTCDRFQYNLAGTVGASTVTQNTVTDLPGFTKSLKVDVTTADASLATSDRLTLVYKIEGQDIQQVSKGTSSAEQLTLSFYIKATKTGTQIVELFDHDNTRHCAKSVTINSSNTWEKKTITYPADTTGAFDNDNAQSLSIFFGLAVGTNFTSGTLATAWAANNNTNRFVGQVNHFDNTDNNFEITGVQLEVGSQATPFEHRSFGEELALCKRYFHRWDSTASVYNNLCMGYTLSATLGRGVVNYPVNMRAAPTLAHDGTFRVYDGSASRSVSDITVNRASTNEMFISFTTSSATINRPAELGANNDATCTIDFIAEL